MKNFSLAHSVLLQILENNVSFSLAIRNAFNDEKNKTLITYDAKAHRYKEGDNPQLVDIGHGHFVYGSAPEIEEYRAIREKGDTEINDGEDIK